MNSVNLIGRVVSDIELKITTSNRSVCGIRIAVKRPFAKDETDFFSANAWGKDAENIAKYFHKGDLIAVSGYLTTRQYEKSGMKIIATELVVENWDFCGEKKQKEEQEQLPYPDLGNSRFDEDDIPF